MPPYKRPGEWWSAFCCRLIDYIDAVSEWVPSHGWTVEDRAALVCEGEDALTAAQAQEDDDAS